MVESKKRKRDEHDSAASSFPAALPVRSKPMAAMTGTERAEVAIREAAGSGPDRAGKRPRLGERGAAPDFVQAAATGDGSSVHPRGIAELDGKPVSGNRTDSAAVRDAGEKSPVSTERGNKRDWQEFAIGEKASENSANAGGKRARLSDDGVAATSSHASSMQDAQPRGSIDQIDIASVVGTSVSGQLSSRAASETRSMSGRDTGNSQVSYIPDAQPRSPIDHSDSFSMSGLTVSDAGSPRVASAARSVSGSDASTDYGSDFSPSDIARLDAKSNASSANGSARYGSDWSEDTKARIIEKVDELAAKRTAEWVSAQPKPASLPRGIEERQRDSR